MTKASIDVDSELWAEFNREVITAYGKLRGARNQAVEEAIKLWLKKQSSNVKKT